ncbi:MAG: chemotaxis protein CheY [Nitrospira bacterium SG8_35_4]|nr:MAG: chemotaxis protein CheY [Nitrospira bacterium SG8_35_4]
MTKEPVIILAEDDAGHAGLIINSLKRSGITNTLLHFEDGEDTLNFLFRRGDGPHREDGVSYILLLDIRMPVIDGIEVMRQVKQDEELSEIPIIMVTTTEDPVEMARCWNLGCHNYFVKPVGFEKFSQTMEQLGKYINDVIIPEIANQ